MDRLKPSSLFLVLLFCLVTLFGCKEDDANKTVSQESSPNAQECDGEVILEIGDVNLHVPRNTAFVNSLELKDIRLNKISDGYDCTGKVVPNVSTYNTGEITIGYRPDKAVKTSYLSMMEHNKRRDFTPKEKLLENGVIHLDSGGIRVESFILPKDIAPTDTDEPALYTCEIFPKTGFHAGVWCHISYYHPSGLFIHFRFPRYESGVNYILERDKQNRDWIDNAIK